MADHDKNEDARPDVAKDDHGKPRENAKDKWHNATETMDEPAAGSPNATKQSQVS